MNELWEILNNKRKLKSFLQGFEVRDIEIALEKFTDTVGKIKDEEKIKLEKELKKQQEVEDAVNQLRGTGVDIDSLISALVAEQKKPTRTARPPKYQYLDDDGVEQTWTGQGRTPKALQTKLDSGANLKDFLIG